MTSSAKMTAGQLLALKEETFNSNIASMPSQKLMETISVLQREMGREQENFDSLSSELGSLKKNSAQHKSVSKEMTLSQGRLTLLMNRGMKCFSQQGKEQNKPSIERSSSAGNLATDLKLKTNGDTTSSGVKAENRVPKADTKPGRRSMIEVQSMNPGRRAQPLRTSDGFKQEMSKVIAVKTNTFENGATATATVPAATKPEPVKAEVNNVNRTVGSQQQTSNVVSSGVSNSVISGSASSTSFSNSLSNLNKAGAHIATEKVSSDNKGTVSSVTLGPIANRSKFISKSSDTISTNQDMAEHKKPDASYHSSRPPMKMVMNENKQMVDLDSFTDRKNMLGELKAFKKDLKPVSATKKMNEVQVQREAEPKAEAIAKSENVYEVNKNNVLGDIRQGLKPSQMKVTKTTEKSEKVPEQKNIPEAAKPKQEKKDSPRVQVEKTQTSVNSMNAVYEAESKKSVTAAVKAVAVAPVKNGVSATRDEETESDDTGGHSSEEDDRFVTEFQFPGIQTKSATTNVKAPQAIDKTENGKPNFTKNVPAAAAAVVKKDNVPPVSAIKTEQKKDIEKPGASNIEPVKLTENQPQYTDDGEELVQLSKVTHSDWDPAKVYAELYKIQMMPDNIEDISHKFIGMEGLMEKLPMNKKKATLLKTWKRRFFKAADGWLHYYESSNRDKPSDSLQLMGGKIEELGPRVFGIDDGRGKYLMVRVPTDNEYGQWKVALQSQTADNVKATYVRPAPASQPHPKNTVIIIDLGSSGIRAGILGERPTLPQIFFPSVVAINKQSGEIIVGEDAMKPSVRRVSQIVHPIQPTNKVDKFNIDMKVMAAIFQKVFSDLKVNPKVYWVMLSTPVMLGEPVKASMMKLLVDELGTKGVCMVQQSLLSLYSYNAMSGIIVDIGQRLEILPIYDGLLIEGGVCRQAYGGAKVLDSLYTNLLENRYKFNTPVEQLLVRYIMEKACYVTDNYTEAKKRCDAETAKFSRTVDLKTFNIPDGAHQEVTLDLGYFKSAEGFFNTDLWEMDYKNLQKQIYIAIQQCPMDSRKHMYRSVYLSGGVTMIPGFADRLQEELRKLSPPSVVVEVHASPQRYHAAYIGACSVAAMEIFQMSCVSADEWRKQGVKACRKWATN